jgi:hypothetical protein
VTPDFSGLRSLAAIAGRKLAALHGADGADALQGIGGQWPMRSWQTMIGGGLEGCGPSQPLLAANQRRFTAATERVLSRESASNCPCGRGNDDRWPGGLRSLAAVAGRKLNTGSTAPTERTPSRESASNVRPVVATMIGGDLEGCGPSQPWPAVNWHHLHGADGADALQGIGQQWPIRSWQR